MAIDIRPLLPNMRRIVTGILYDTCTIHRTGVQHPCDLSSSGKTDRIPGLPSYLKVPIWELMMPDGVDVKPQDVITVAGKGDYIASIVYSPVTISVSTDVDVVQASLSAFGNLPFAAPLVVTFTHKTTGLTLQASAMILPTDLDPLLPGGVAEFKNLIIWSPDVRYGDGSRVRAGHLVSCVEILGYEDNGDLVKMPITKPRYTAGLMALAHAYFAEGP